MILSLTASDPPVSESVAHCKQIEAKPDAIVLIADDSSKAGMLRDRGLVAVARPDGGLWNSENLEPLRGRVVVVLNTEPFGGYDGPERDAIAVASVAAVARVVVPLALLERSDLRPSLSEVVLSLGPELFTAEIRSTLETEAAADQDFIRFKLDPPEPRELKVEPFPVPPLVPEMIPSPLRGWIADITERVGCPIEFVAVAAIVAFAALVGRKIGIRPKRCDDWQVIPNLWGAIVGRPGVMKTPSLAEALKFMHQLVAEAREQHTTSLLEYEAVAMLRAAKGKAAKEELERAAKRKDGKPSIPDDQLLKLAENAHAERVVPPPALKRYVVNDTTVEKLGEILAENPNGVLLFRDELVGFLRCLDKAGREGDRQAYLEFWNGDGKIVYDRIGRGTIHIDGACVSLIGGVQPGPLAAYVRDAAKAGGGDGLIARFQLMVWPDDPGSWRNVDRWPDSEAKAHARETFRKLDALEADAIGAMREDTESVPFLRFSADAQEFFDGWREELENVKLRGEHENPLIEEHLAKYRSLMPSLSLIFHLIEVVDGVAAGPVTRHSASLAAAWCDFLECHARRVYMGAFDANPLAARRLADRIRAGDVPSLFRVRDLVRRGWSGLDETRDVEKAVNVLEDHGWVYGVDKRPGATGGHPTVEYHVNRRARRCKP